MAGKRNSLPYCSRGVAVVHSYIPPLVQDPAFSEPRLLAVVRVAQLYNKPQLRHSYACLGA